MNSTGFVAYLILAGAAVLQAVLLAIQAWEHRRYGRSCLRTCHRHRPAGRALVLAPCKGSEADLEENLRGLMRQDYPDYEVTFIVEDAGDGACRAIRRVMDEHPGVATRLLVAGRASDGGQKVHNLRMATASLPPEIEYLVFVDSDGRPRPECLRMAIARLHRPGMGAATGYRWFIPKRPTLANHLLTSINGSLMALLGRDTRGLVWGGAWALRRETFHRIGLPQAWQRVLSDDLVASRLLRRARLGVRFEPMCIVASPVDRSLREVLSFIRRQYLISRHYARGWWWFALASTSVRSLAWLASAAVFVAGLLPGGPPAWIPTAVLAMLWGLDALRGWAVQDLARACFPGQEGTLRRWRRFHLASGPAAGLVHWLCILSSIFGRRITWRGIDYRLLRGGRIAVERPLEEGGSAAGPATEEDLFRPAA